MRCAPLLLVTLAVLVGAQVSSAKDFRPGDLRLCNARECVTLVRRRLLRELSAFVYGEARVARAPKLRRGAPVLELRFENGYVPGLVGGAKLDRFRSHGVICGRFTRGVWYLVPPQLAHDLRGAAGRLTPLRLSGSVPPSC